MKKLKVFLVVLLIVPMLHASPLELYSMDSWVWKSTLSLCVANGVMPPPPVSPVTAYDMENAVSAIPEAMLDSDERAIRDSILSELGRGMILESEHASFSPHTVIAPEMYTQTEKLSKQWDHLTDIKDMMPLFNLGFELDVADIVYAFGDWTVLSPGLDNVFDKYFASNISLNELQHEGLLNGGIVIGNGLVNGFVARTRQEFGYGLTGNMMVGDNFSYQDFMRLNLRTKWFNYTLNVTEFNQEANIPDSDGSRMDIVRTMFNGMRTYQGIHRFDFRFGKRFSMVIQEGLMLHTTAAFDMRLLNPFLFYHGFFNSGGNNEYHPGQTADEANNYFGVEFAAILSPHLMMNLHLLFDQIQMPGDINEDFCLPHAYAALLNFESPWIIGKHYMNAWYECVLVMPYTYLNRKVQDGEFNTNLDMIVGYQNFLQDEIGYAGYRWGSDSIMNAVGVSWGMPGVYDCDFSVSYLIHGQYGYGYKSIILERGPEHFTDMMLAGVGLDGAEHRVIVNLEGSYRPFDCLEIKAGLGWVGIVNLGTGKGRNSSDLQFRIGLSFDPMEFMR